jgi:hypothetical protein
MYRKSLVTAGEIVRARAVVSNRLRPANDWRDPSESPVLTILTVWRR